MGKIRRYGKAYYARDIIQQHDRGEYVLYTDHVAECDRLRAEVEQLKERNASLFTQELDLRRAAQKEVLELRAKVERLGDRDNALCSENNSLKNDLNVLQAEYTELKACNERLKDLLKSLGCTVDQQGNVTNFYDDTNKCKMEVWFNGKQYIPYTQKTYPKTLTAVWDGVVCLHVLHVLIDGVLVTAPGSKYTHTETLGFDELLSKCTKPDDSPCGREVDDD